MVASTPVAAVAFALVSALSATLAQAGHVTPSGVALMVRRFVDWPQPVVSSSTAQWVFLVAIGSSLLPSARSGGGCLAVRERCLRADPCEIARAPVWLGAWLGEPLRTLWG